MGVRVAASDEREDNLMLTGPYVKRDRRKIHLDLNESHYLRARQGMRGK